MDGVLADLKSAIAEYNMVSMDEIEKYYWGGPYWNNMMMNANMRDIFANLNWMPQAKELLSFFNDREIPYTFLSRPADEPKTFDCISGKMAWLHSHKLDDHPVIFEFDKEKYSGLDHVLIDDDPYNISKWNDAGGIGMLYSVNRYDEILDEVEHILNED
jgi:hypothetical protein